MLYRFDQFEFDEARYELRIGSSPGGELGEVIELQPKVTEVLLHLLRNADRTLTKDEILDAVWRDMSITEASLTRCISVARRALGEHEGEPRIIRTIRGRGYRIGVPVERVEATAPRQAVSSSAAPADASLAPHAVEPKSAPTHRWGRFWVLASAVAILGLLWLARPFASGPSPSLNRPAGPYPRNAVAVLPFADLRATDARSLEAEGLAMEVMDSLARWPELRMTSLRSAFRFAPNDEWDPVVTGKVLGVGTLVTGSIRPLEDGRIQVQVAVIDTQDGFRRWSESVRLAPEVLAATQGEIAARVGEALGIDAMKPLRRSAAFVEARRRYHLGRLAIFEADRESLLDAVATYERALEIQPEPIHSYVALAEVYHRLWELDEELGREAEAWLTSAEAVVLEALERAPEHPDALTVFGTVQASRKFWEGAEAAYRLALEHRGGAIASHRLAALLMLRGRVDEARTHVERALRLDPMEPSVLRGAGRLHLFSGEPEKAIPYLRRVLELSPTDPWAPRLLANAQKLSGDNAGARESLMQLLPGFARPLARIQVRLLGEDRAIRNLLAVDVSLSGRTCRNDAYGTAMMWAHLGDRENMISCLTEASRRHLWYTISEPAFRPYRDDPRFRSIVDDAGFTPLGGWTSLDEAG